MEPQEIIDEVATEFGVTYGALVGPSKARAISTARSVAMYAVRKRTDLSFPAIGVLFNRDHSTIVTGCGRVEKLLTDHGVELTHEVLTELATEVNKKLVADRFVEWEARLSAHLAEKPKFPMHSDDDDEYDAYDLSMGEWGERVAETIHELLEKDGPYVR